MQTRDQGKRPKDWKVVAAIATASALGISGLALAGPSGGRDTPDPINLRDQTNITAVTTTSSVPTTTSISGDDLREASDPRNSLDSPFDDPTTTTTIVVVDPTNPVVSSSGDSPDVTNPPAPAPAPDPAPPPEGSADSGSADSGSAGSADNSADS